MLLGESGQPIELLSHNSPECCGNWRSIYSDGKKQMIIKCEICGKTYNATGENRLAAIDENYAGIYLKRMTIEGGIFLNENK